MDQWLDLRAGPNSDLEHDRSSGSHPTLHPPASCEQVATDSASGENVTSQAQTRSSNRSHSNCQESAKNWSNYDILPKGSNILNFSNAVRYPYYPPGLPAAKTGPLWPRRVAKPQAAVPKLRTLRYRSCLLLMRGVQGQPCITNNKPAVL